MMKDPELLADFQQNLNQFFADTNIQRAEMARAYAYRDCDQWSLTEYNERKRLDKSITVVNLAAPLVRAVSGTEVLQDKKLDFVALDEDFDADADDIDKAVSYCQHVSGYDSEQSTAREDAATCGIGATVTWLDMSIKGAISGRPIVESIPPQFLFYDRSSRGRRLNDRARWAGYADPVRKADLDEIVKKALAKKRGKQGAIAAAGGTDFNAYLLAYARQGDALNIDFIYNYFWWEYEPIIDVMNPFAGDEQLAALVMQDDDVANEVGKTTEALGIDWKAPWWSLDAEGFAELKNLMELIAGLTGVQVVKLNSSEREGKCYYKARIARGVVLEKGKSYTQRGFPLNFITGYYDEQKNVFYGLMRPISFIQDALNIAMSDMLGYVKGASHGGNAWIEGAGDALESIKKHKAHEDAITPVPPGTVITPKGLPNTAQALVEFIRLLMEIMPRALGLGEEFLGVITTGDMTDSLYGKVMKQSYAVLANFANNSASYSMKQGQIFEDIVRLMAAAEEGKALPIMNSDQGGAERVLRLYAQNLAREYQVRIVERPMSADERQEAFNNLSQLVPQYLQAGINIMPVLSKYAPLDPADRKQLVELSTPQPQQPDPLNQALLDSQAKLQYAQADKLGMDAEEKRQILGKVAPEKDSIIMKNEAQALKSLADAGRDDGALTEKDAAQIGSKERMHLTGIASGERRAV